MADGPTNSDYSRAIGQLTIYALWREAGLPGAPARDGVYKSPFRQERTPSFSVVGGGKGFKDFGSEISGGVVAFAKLAWPDKNEDALRDFLIDLAGTRTVKPAPGGKVVPFDPKAPAAPDTAQVVAVDPRLEKAAKTIERNARLRRMEDELYLGRDALLEPPRVDAGKLVVPEWPDFVAARYAEGVAALGGDMKRMAKLAEERGWPVSWVEELVAGGLVSYPWERWTDPEGQWARRQKAFRVDWPLIVQEPEGARVELRPVGYHQRAFLPAKGQEPARKMWLYVPSSPKKAARSEFERQILRCAQERGLHAGDEHTNPEGFIPPLPFVLGQLTRPRLVVLLEGQWDAITFWGACGGFNDGGGPEDMAVFGIRGAQGLGVFLGYWGRWLRANAPKVWAIADNDNAGRTWREAPAAKIGELQPPSLAERLQAAGAREVVVSWLRPGRWGKDFNDYYRAAKPGPDKMFAWMAKERVLADAGVRR